MESTYRSDIRYNELTRTLIIQEGLILANLHEFCLVVLYLESTSVRFIRVVTVAICWVRFNNEVLDFSSSHWLVLCLSS